MVKQVELIRRCQQGDREAMGRLYTAMHDELLSVCRRYVANNSVAEDLLHDAFLLIFSKIGELRSPLKADRWMRKVVKNVALLYAKKHNQVETVSIDEVGDAVMGEASGRGITTEPITYDELMHIVDTLPDGYRRVFRLSVLEGLSHQEIAELLNIEPHSSSSQLYRAKSMLRNSLGVLLLSLLVVVVPLEIYKTMKRKNIVLNQNVVVGSVVGNASQRCTIVGNGSQRCTHAIVDEPSKYCNGADTLPEHCVPSVEDITEKSLAVIAEKNMEILNIDSILVGEEPATLGSVAYCGDSRWHLSLAYSGLPNENSQSLPIGIEGTNGPIDSTAHHRMPLTIGLDVSHQLNNRWSLNGGLRYTLLSSEFQMGNTLLHIDRSQHVRYLGLSLGATYQLWPVVGNVSKRYDAGHFTKRRYPLSVYTSASATCDLPLRSTVETTYVKGDKAVSSDNARLHPSTQWSLGAGLGAQYSLTPAVAFFVEPSLYYYIPTGDGIDSWRTEHPLTFSLPLGVRITF